MTSGTSSSRTKSGLFPIVQVVQPTNDADWQNYTDPGIAMNSGFLDGLPTAEAKAKMIDWLESNGKGKRRIQYKLRDWLFSRQRYWGEPFPIIWKDGHHHAIPKANSRCSRRRSTTTNPAARPSPSSPRPPIG
jgi:leucyl-tRNA synthetase